MLSLGAQAAPFGKMTERSKQKAAAEAERAGVQQKLSALKKDISKTESAKDDAADTLAESEQAISTPTAAARPAAGAGGHQRRCKAVGRARQAGGHGGAAEAAAGQAARAVRGRNEDRIKLLLSGDNPNRINRDLQMLAYVSQAQARLLERCAPT
jgi:septal ring factor EnvC (AmiA/AmiB activator)